MKTPDMLLNLYKHHIEKHCTRSFEEHRQMPCNVVKEAVFNDTEPKCKGCSYVATKPTE